VRIRAFTGWQIALAFGLGMVLSGCGSYSLRGRVIEGGSPMILFVPEGDESLDYGRPISEASISLTRDPDQLNRETVAQSRSGPSGWFAMPVDAFGAGWMDESWEVVARARGYFGVEQTLRLPGEGDGMVMLIIMSPGFDPQGGEENLMEQFERFR
jgi:hypothetical protein